MATVATPDDEMNLFESKIVASMQCCLLISWQFLFHLKQDRPLKPVSGGLVRRRRRYSAPIFHSQPFSLRPIASKQLATTRNGETEWQTCKLKRWLRRSLRFGHDR
jgi:hypothetical protein